MCMSIEIMAPAILTISFPWSKICSMSDKIAKVSLKNFSRMKIAWFCPEKRKIVNCGVLRDQIVCELRCLLTSSGEQV